MAYAAVVIEGGLFPPDLVEQIAEGSAAGQRPDDFGLPASARLSDEMQAAFSDIRSFWDAFQRRLGHTRESATTITRDAWVLPLLERLGYDLTFQRAAVAVGGDSFAISHRAGADLFAPPVHIEAAGRTLDARDGARRSPHALVQEFLNRSDALWGIVTNGERLRLLRDSARVSRPTFLEFDLRAIVEGNLYSEFVLLYRLLHRSRLPHGGADAHDCVLERGYQAGIEQGGRVREHLAEGVKRALDLLGQALLAHPGSDDLRAALGAGRLSEAGYYRQLLRLVYRLLFLMVAEERKLLFPEGDAGERQVIYSRYYSVGRLRDRCERPFAGNRHTDLWPGLLQTFRLFGDREAAAAFGLMPLNGELFGPEGCPDLEAAACDNAALLGALFHLSTFLDSGDGGAKGRGRGRRAGKAGVRRRVNYAGLDVEELGSVYEGLLEYHPRVTLDPAPRFDLVAGSDRKTTGSYYTPPELVHELIGSALLPVIDDRLKGARTREAKERALLGLRVCDPASGSGHFLLAAARRIARELARVRSDEAEPAPKAYREALRDVIRQCIYAVDKNPLAVDLCKVALWIEGHSPGLPLSFLDAHVKCGESLVGVFDLDALSAGIPDEAYKEVTGDDKATASALRKRNKVEREGATPTRGGRTPAGQFSLDTLLSAGLEGVAKDLAPDFAALAEQDEATPDDVHTKEALYAELRGQGGRWWHYKTACDLWTSAFFAPLTPASEEVVPTTDTVRRYLGQPGAAHGRLVGEATALAARLRFFHWPLEFPEVFAGGGFDCVLGNPPWERIKLQEQEFFAARDRAIADAPNKAARDRLIKELPKTNPALALAFAEAKHEAEAQSRFIRAGGRFPLCGRGDINTYSVFAETMRTLINGAGRTGVIVPSGIATDDTTKVFFGDLMERGQLASLYDFENQGAFDDVDSRYKFSLVTLTGQMRPKEHAEFAFFLHGLDGVVELRDSDRRFVLSAADLELLNPNTRTAPIFRSRRDADLTRAIYQRVPVLIREGDPEENPWGIRFATLFHMSNDSHLFRTREQLEREGWRLAGNRFTRGADRYLPLYEAKLLHHFDHRWATYDAAPAYRRPSRAADEDSDDVETRDLTPAEKADPATTALPRYWVPEADVAAKLAGRWERGWLLGWRDICRSTDERTVIAGVLPRVGVGDKFLLMMPSVEPVLAASLLANLDSFVFDYNARQKVGGTSLKYFTMKQLPVLPPAKYTAGCPWAARGQVRDWLAPRVLELTYTAWDLEPFARDLGYDGPPFRWDEGRRFLLRCELDAAFFHLYGIARDDVDYIMDTFPIVRRKDEAAWGEYRAKRVILEMYDDIARARAGGPPYQTRLDPPPADARAAHGE